MKTDDDKPIENEDDLLSHLRDEFERCSDAESENRQTFIDDTRFSRLGEQWPDDIKSTREEDGRPCLTINKMPSFIRQVVNDSRLNKPQPKVRAADDNADPETAEVINGLIRNIEYISNADTVYDTAVENSVSGGLGYIRVGLDYAFDDSFDMDITIDRIINPLAVYGDPDAVSADGSCWNIAFVVDRMRKRKFKAKYGDKADTDWEGSGWSGLKSHWMDDKTVLVAEAWERDEVTKEIVQLIDGEGNKTVWDVDDLEANEDMQLALETGMAWVDVDQTTGEEVRRTTKSHKVTQTIMSGADILERREWPGKYIPIIPVYGDEFCVDGQRYFRSLIHNAKDSQRQFNYWRTAATELVALAPRVPWIGRKGTFDSDAQKWATANTISHDHIEYDTEAPQRQPLDSGTAAGSLQEAATANDDMKAVLGMNDASLGARSNETSGIAIKARQREGDVSTFHFIDNLSRSIRHMGKIIIDLIPSVYNTQRVIRVLGEDGAEDNKPINQEYQQTDEQGRPMQGDDGSPIMAIHDLSVGKYDLMVDTGPSFTTRREESAAQMTDFVQAFPQAAPIIGDLYAKALDWPNADEIADRLKKINPALQGMDQSPEMQQMQQQMQQGQQQMEQMQNVGNQMQHYIRELELKIKEMQADHEIDIMKARTDQFEADTKRRKVNAETMQEAMFPLTPPPNFNGG